MHHEDPLRGLSREWQQTGSSSGALPSLPLALRQQRSERLKHGLQWGTASLALGVAFWFFSLPPSAVTLGSGAVLACAAALDVRHTFRHRLPVTRWSDWSPEGLLSYRKRLAELELRSAHHYILGSLGLLLFAALLWVHAWQDAAFAASGFPRLFSACAIPVAAICGISFGMSMRRRRRAVQRLSGLVGEFTTEG
jgi:hypothetical protein